MWRKHPNDTQGVREWTGMDPANPRAHGNITNAPQRTLRPLGWEGNYRTHPNEPRAPHGARKWTECMQRNPTSQRAQYALERTRQHQRRTGMDGRHPNQPDVPHAVREWIEHNRYNSTTTKAVHSRSPYGSSGSFVCACPIPVHPGGRSCSFSSFPCTLVFAFGRFPCALGIVGCNRSIIVRSGGRCVRSDALRPLSCALVLVGFVRVGLGNSHAPW